MDDARVSASKKTGRPATGIGTPIQVRLQPEQLAALDAWIARHDVPRPSRPEAVRKLIGQGLTIPLPPREVSPVAPYAKGDRVRHRLFGLGTVTGEATAMVGADADSPSGLRDAGWRVSVEWDDPARAPANIADFALEKIDG